MDNIMQEIQSIQVEKYGDSWEKAKKLSAEGKNGLEARKLSERTAIALLESPDMVKLNIDENGKDVSGALKAVQEVLYKDRSVSEKPPGFNEKTVDQIFDATSDMSKEGQMAVVAALIANRLPGVAMEVAVKFGQTDLDIYIPVLESIKDTFPGSDVKIEFDAAVVALKEKRGDEISNEKFLVYCEEAGKKVDLYVEEVVNKRKGEEVKLGNIDDDISLTSDILVSIAMSNREADLTDLVRQKVEAVENKFVIDTMYSEAFKGSSFGDNMANNIRANLIESALAGEKNKAESDFYRFKEIPGMELKIEKGNSRLGVLLKDPEAATWVDLKEIIKLGRNLDQLVEAVGENTETATVLVRKASMASEALGRLKDSGLYGNSTTGLIGVSVLDEFNSNIRSGVGAFGKEVLNGEVSVGNTKVPFESLRQSFFESEMTKSEELAKNKSVRVSRLGAQAREKFLKKIEESLPIYQLREKMLDTYESAVKTYEDFNNQQILPVESQIKTLKETPSVSFLKSLFVGGLTESKKQKTLVVLQKSLEEKRIKGGELYNKIAEEKKKFDGLSFDKVKIRELSKKSRLVKYYLENGEWIDPDELASIAKQEESFETIMKESTDKLNKKWQSLIEEDGISINALQLSDEKVVFRFSGLGVFEVSGSGTSEIFKDLGKVYWKGVRHVLKRRIYPESHISLDYGSPINYTFTGEATRNLDIKRIDLRTPEAQVSFVGLLNS